MTLTGRQIRQARTLLGLRPSELASKVGCLTTLGVRQPEENEDECVLSEDVPFVFRRILERLGIEFTDEAKPSVRLQKGNSADAAEGWAQGDGSAR